MEIVADASISLAWAGTFKTREELAQHVGSFLPYLQDSFRCIHGGWRLAFDPQELVASMNLVQGNHWKDWLATNCPALVIYGQSSLVTKQAHLEQMAIRRPNTRMQVLKGGHIVHLDNPADFTETVYQFLQSL